MSVKHLLFCTLLAGASISTAQAASSSCPVTYQQLKSAVMAAGQADHTGFNNKSWAVVVDRSGMVCAVAFSGYRTSGQWPASRQIAAAKAYSANGYSLDIGTPTGALSTAQLYQFVQPSNANVANPLFGLNGGNVIDASAAYAGNFADFGTALDPMVGHRVGGTITFGGGLALYNGTTVVGGVGVSGDTACADHSVAWRTRINLGLQQPNPADQLTFATNASMTNGHPHCPNDANTQGVAHTKMSQN